MTRVCRVLSVLLVLGLVLPVCVKAFAPTASATTISETQNSDGADMPGNLPCVSCCGGWTALLPSYVVPEPRRDDLTIQANADVRSGLSVLLAVSAHDPPPEWRLLLALPHSYSLMHARTDRLLL